MSTFSGLYPAVVTPMRSDESLDIDAMISLSERTAAVDGVSGLVALGHAGELLFLDHDERIEVVAAVRKAVPASQQLVVGVEGNTPRRLAEDAARAVDAGADALLVCPPFDMRPTRNLVTDAASVTRFFEAIAARVDVPMIIFQYAKASGLNYPLPVLHALADIDNVVAIKAGTRDVTDYVLLHDAVADRLDVLAASDGPPLLGMLLHGASGALIGVSGVGTQLWAELVALAASGDITAASTLFHTKCLALTDAIYEHQVPTTYISSVASTKEALYQLGLIPDPTVRAPLISPDATAKARIKAALETAGLA